jgi:hypothetical protein
LYFGFIYSHSTPSVGNTSTKDLGGGIWDLWYGPSGRDDGKSAHDLIPAIKSSLAGKALEASGFTLNETRMREIQTQAEVKCPVGIEPITCNPYNGPCLFNLDDDPCEQRNLAESQPDIVKRLLDSLQAYNKTAIPPMLRRRDPDGFPMRWGNVWTTFKDNIDEGTAPGECDKVVAGSGTSSYHNVFYCYGITLSLLYAVIWQL